MDTRAPIVLSAALTALAALMTPASAGKTAGPAPDVLVITVDTLRADHMSSYGYARPTSPNLDRVIDAGVRFSNARTVEPLTTPALCSMLTSVHPHQHGASRNGLRIRSGLASLPKTLAEHGYRTAAFVGNWTLRDKLSNLAEHFDEYEEVLTRKRWFGLVSSETSADDLTEEAGDWIAAHAGDSDPPFFLWVHYVEPHAPYRKHEELLAPLGIPEKGKVRPEDRYDTEIAFADRSIGQLLQRLDELGLTDKTLIVFASDHGESLGEHNYWGHGRHLYESGLHIPMALSWRGRLEPRIVDAPALNIDIAPTVLGLLGLAEPPEFLGYDWTAVLEGRAKPDYDRVTLHQAHKGAVLSRHDSDLVRRAGLLEVGLIHGRTKEVLRVTSGQHWSFDLGERSSESEVLVESDDAPAADLRAWLQDVSDGLSDLDDTEPEPLDEESVERLRSLGYAD